MKIVPWRIVVGYSVRWSTCNLPVYKASECKHTIIRLHCATSKFSLWNMEYVANGGAFERPCIYRTSICVHTHVYNERDTCNILFAELLSVT